MRRAERAFCYALALAGIGGTSGGCDSPAPAILDASTESPADLGVEASDLLAADSAQELSGEHADTSVAPSFDALPAPPDLAPSFPIVEDPIPFSETRKSEMAAYSLKHYGSSTWQLEPKQIVLHFTAISTYAPVFDLFSMDTPNRGELPGTCTHYVVDKDGTIYHLVDDTVRCRHAVGLNHVALGIEMVQETGIGASWADQQILARAPQIESALRLVKWLQANHGISNENVIGHSMANQSSFFTELSGWVSDHSDWQSADVLTFRARLAALP